MSGTWTSAEVKRTQVGLLGIDIAEITGERAVLHALSSGDLVRLEDAVDVEDVQWIFRIYLTTSRFGNPAYGSFMPFRSEHDTGYQKTRPLLDAVFAEGAYPKLRDHAKTTAQLLLDPNNLPDDKILGESFARALCDRFGIVPQGVLNAASKQPAQLADSLNPLVAIPAKPAMKRVFGHMKEALAESNFPGLNELDSVKTAPLDFAHSFLAPLSNGPPVLRQIAQDPYKPVRDIFTETGLVPEVVRMPRRDTTLGGMFSSDNPLKARFTIVRINIRKAAQETGNLAWAFGSGTDSRRCAAEGEILRFFEMVRTELIRLRSTTGSITQSQL